MDNGQHSRFGLDGWLSPSTIRTLLVWLLLIGGVWLALKWRDTPLGLSSYLPPIVHKPEIAHVSQPEPDSPFGLP